MTGCSNQDLSPQPCQHLDLISVTSPWKRTESRGAKIICLEASRALKILFSDTNVCGGQLGMYRRHKPWTAVNHLPPLPLFFTFAVINWLPPVCWQLPLILKVRSHLDHSAELDSRELNEAELSKCGPVADPVTVKKNKKKHKLTLFFSMFRAKWCMWLTW